MKSENDDLTARMRVLRESYGFSGHGGQQAFAKHLGVGGNRWSNVENGRDLGIELALIIVERCPGTSLDWLYLGKADGLTLSTMQRLGIIEPGGSLMRQSAASTIAEKLIEMDDQEKLREVAELINNHLRARPNE
jgi:transcriptional regulator with XRE-family HTH domain